MSYCSRVDSTNLYILAKNLIYVGQFPLLMLLAYYCCYWHTTATNSISCYLQAAIGLILLQDIFQQCQDSGDARSLVVPTANVLKRGLPLCLSETVSVAGPIPGLCFNACNCNFTFGQFVISFSSLICCHFLTGGLFASFQSSPSIQLLSALLLHIELIHLIFQLRVFMSTLLPLNQSLLPRTCHCPTILSLPANL